MKHTFSNNVFNWLMILTSLLFAAFHLWTMIGSLHFSLNNIVPTLFFTSLAIMSFLSLIRRSEDGEKFSILFILGNLLLFPISFIVPFLTRELKYGLPGERFEFPVLYLIFLSGVALLYFSKTFSRKQDERNSYFRVFSVVAGIFLIINLFLIEVSTPGYSFSLIKYLIFALAAAALFFLGYQSKYTYWKGSRLLLSIFLLISLFYATINF